jgi:hypothetical protein
LRKWHITTTCYNAKFGRHQLISDGSQGRFRCVDPPGALPPVDKKSGTRLTGPVNRGVCSKSIVPPKTRPQPGATGFVEELADFSKIPKGGRDRRQIAS